MVDAARTTRDVISAYVGQLTEGCDDASCDEVLCATGRRNVSGRRQREYTARSARTLAISLASGPRPQARLCPRYHSRPETSRPAKPESIRDPSSWSQMLSDTPVVRAACDGEHATPGESYTGSNRPTQLYSTDVEEYLVMKRQHLDLILKHPAECPVRETSLILCECLLRLAEIIPSNIMERQCCETNVLIRGGSALPPPWPKFSSLKDSIDGPPLTGHITYRPAWRVFCRILEIIDARGQLIEPFVADLKQRLETGPDKAELGLYAVTLLSKAFHDYWDGEPVLQIPSNAGIAATSLKILFQVSRAIPGHDEFCFPLLSFETVDKVKMLNTFNDCLQTQEKVFRDKIHFLEIPDIFKTADTASFFRYANHLRMRAAHSEAHRNYSVMSRIHHITSTLPGDVRLKYIQEHYLVLSVSRASALEDAFDQLWQRHQGELLRPLRVRLGEMEEYEIGQDLGGVQIEFFNLACRELMKEDHGMFTTDVSTGYSYFRPGSLQPLHKFELCGLLFGLAMYNGIAIPISFPQAYYYHLKGQAVLSTHLIEDGWPIMARSLRSVVTDEVTELDLEYPMEANGLRLSISRQTIRELDDSDEDKSLYVSEVSEISGVPNNGSGPVDINNLSWPGWRVVEAPSEALELRDDDRNFSIPLYLYWLIAASAFPQWCAFKKGFYSIIDRRSVKMLSATSFRDILEGSNDLDIEKLRDATQYDEPYSDIHPYIDSFWQLISSWPKEKQKQLVKFVTAAERIPAGGADRLTFKIQGAMYETVDALPTSSTCFGVLTLPEYPDMQTLERKLSQALEFGLEGFGTG